MLLLSRFIISGHSMEPTLRANDSVLVSSLPYLFTAPKVNDIVICNDPQTKTMLLKRIKKIQSGSLYFVTGDNLDDSHDSRKFGMLERKDIIGKVILCLNL